MRYVETHLNGKGNPDGYRGRVQASRNGRGGHRRFTGPLRSLDASGARQAHQDAIAYLAATLSSAPRPFSALAYDVTDPDTGRKLKPRVPIKMLREDGPTATYVNIFLTSDDHPLRPGTVVAIKVGTTITKNRSSYVKTIGLQVREAIKPIVFADRAAAEHAASDIEATFDKHPGFVRVAEESFVPDRDMDFTEAKSLVLYSIVALADADLADAI